MRLVTTGQSGRYKNKVTYPTETVWRETWKLKLDFIVKARSQHLISTTELQTHVHEHTVSCINYVAHSNCVYMLSFTLSYRGKVWFTHIYIQVTYRSFGHIVKSHY